MLEVWAHWIAVECPPHFWDQLFGFVQTERDMWCTSPQRFSPAACICCWSVTEEGAEIPLLFAIVPSQNAFRSRQFRRVGLFPDF